MKKLVLLGFAAALCATGVWAGGRQESDIDIFAGFPYTIEKSSGASPLAGNQTIDAESTMRSISFGFSTVSWTSEKIGIGVYDNFILPQELSTTINGNTVTAKRDDYDLIMGVDMLWAPVFMLYSNDYFRLPLAVGFHGMTLAASTEYAAIIGFNLGVGLNIAAEYSFVKHVYVLARAQAVYDFYNFSTITANIYNFYLNTYTKVTTSDSGTISSFTIVPQIGLGFRINPR
jgi:hypothetical protein